MTTPVLDAAVRALLERSRLAHLATADRAARPHVIPLCYALDGDRIVFVVDEKPKAPGRTLKRLRNMIENSAVALVVDVWDEDWTRLEYALVHGDAEITEDEAVFTRAVALLRARYPQYRAMALEAGKHPIVVITPRRVHHWRASRG